MGIIILVDSTVGTLVSLVAATSIFGVLDCLRFKYLRHINKKTQWLIYQNGEYRKFDKLDVI